MSRCVGNRNTVDDGYGDGDGDDGDDDGDVDIDVGDDDDDNDDGDDNFGTTTERRDWSADLLERARAHVTDNERELRARYALPFLSRFSRIL